MNLRMGSPAKMGSRAGKCGACRLVILYWVQEPTQVRPMPAAQVLEPASHCNVASNPLRSVQKPLRCNNSQEWCHQPLVDHDCCGGRCIRGACLDLPNVPAPWCCVQTLPAGGACADCGTAPGNPIDWLCNNTSRFLHADLRRGEKRLLISAAPSCGSWRLRSPYFPLTRTRCETRQSRLCWPPCPCWARGIRSMPGRLRHACWGVAWGRIWRRRTLTLSASRARTLAGACRRPLGSCLKSALHMMRLAMVPRGQPCRCLWP